MPICGLCLGDVGVDNLATIVIEYDQDKKHAEGHGRGGKEVDGDNIFGVVLKEGIQKN